jgi:hypothetical protein
LSLFNSCNINQMARAGDKGPFGSANGKIDNLVVYKLNGQDVIRSIGRRITPPLQKELGTQQNIKVLNAFLVHIKDYCKVGFDLEATGTTSNYYNLATKYNASSIIGEYPDRCIDYTKVIVTKGKMPVVENASFQITEDGVEFSWDPSYRKTGIQSDDQVMLLLYSPKNTFAYGITSGSARSAGKELLNMTKFLKNYSFHAYISFVSNNRKSISDSLYLGEVKWEL